MEEEIWKDIPGFESIYQASSIGRVKSLFRFVNASKGGLFPVKEKILKQSIDSNGYLMVGLSVKCVVKISRVHVLVALCFKGARPVGKEVLHGDGNKLNNNEANLSYGTRSENMLDRTRHGNACNPKWIDNKGSRQWKTVLNDEKVLEIKNLLLEGKMNQIQIGNKFSVSSKVISGIKKNRNWKHITL